MTTGRDSWKSASCTRVALTAAPSAHEHALDRQIVKTHRDCLLQGGECKFPPSNVEPSGGKEGGARHLIGEYGDGGDEYENRRTENEERAYCAGDR